MAVQVRACSRAVCKTAILATSILVVQNGPFSTRQLRGVERQQVAQIGGYSSCLTASVVTDGVQHGLPAAPWGWGSVGWTGVGVLCGRRLGI